MIFICDRDRVYFFQYGGQGIRECPICHRPMDHYVGSIPITYRSIRNPSPPRTPRIAVPLDSGR